MKFCVKCGKDIKKGIFCETCSPKSKDHKELTILICDCGKYFSKKRWTRYKEVKDMVKKVIHEKLKNKMKLEFPEKIDMPYNKAEFEVKSDDSIIKIVLLKNKCNLCGRKGTEYYEGILQIRSENERNSEEAVIYINKELGFAAKKGIYVNKTVKQKNGVDMYLTSQRYVQELARKIHRRFGGIIKINARLFSRNKQTSKNLYRVNAFVELPSFTLNDIVKVNNKVVKIIKLGKKIMGRNLMNKKQVAVDYGKKDFKILKQYETSISKTHPQIEAINPLTYQSEIIKNANNERINQKIKVVIDKGLYLV